MSKTMETIAYNKSNWSGEEATVVIKPRSFRVKGSDLHGNFSIKTDKDSGQYARVTIKDGEETIDTLTVYNLDGDWYAEFCDSSREASHPVVTALQIIHNTY